MSGSAENTLWEIAKSLSGEQVSLLVGILVASFTAGFFISKKLSDARVDAANLRALQAESKTKGVDFDWGHNLPALKDAKKSNLSFDDVKKLVPEEKKRRRELPEGHPDKRLTSMQGLTSPDDFIDEKLFGSKFSGEGEVRDISLLEIQGHKLIMVFLAKSFSLNFYDDKSAEKRLVSARKGDIIEFEGVYSKRNSLGNCKILSIKRT